MWIRRGFAKMARVRFVRSMHAQRIDNKIAHSVEFEFHGPLAQLVEQLTLNQRVAGSSPARLIFVSIT